MQFDIMFVKHLNGLLENNNFCIQCFGFHYFKNLTRGKWHHSYKVTLIFEF